MNTSEQNVRDPVGLVLASGNVGKLKELRALLPQHIKVLGPAEAGLPQDLPEDGSTLEENALQKAREAHRLCGFPCLADDSGLEVLALDGAPGVYSAHYAGPRKDPEANMDLLLKELQGCEDRRARFRTVLALVDGLSEQCFEGYVEGVIATERHGDQGFGYDPIFIPEGGTRTFAQMDAITKNSMSHRARAMHALVEHLSRR